MKPNGKYILLNICWLLAIAEALAQCLFPRNTRLDERQLAPSDTVVYKYESPCSKGDTTIGNYKVSCTIRPNGEYTTAKHYGDTIAYVNENTELLMNVQYKNSVILSTVITREEFKEQMGFPDNFQEYVLTCVNGFKVENDTFMMEVSINIPDTDFLWAFELSITNNGNRSIRDITPMDWGDDGPFATDF